MTVSITPEKVAKLDGEIRLGIQFLTELETLLDNERKALKIRDFDAMHQCVESKEALLKSITKNITDRNRCFTDMGVEPSKAGFDTLLKALPPQVTKTLQKHWDDLSECLERVKGVNFVNHRVVARGLENTSRLLAILQGQNINNQIYGHSGDRNNLSSQTSLGKA